VLAPTWLPDFLVFNGASFWPKQRIFEIVYGLAPNNPNENTLALMEQPIPENGDDCIIYTYPIACSMLVGASATIEEVQIGDIPGEYVKNGVWQAIDDTGQWGWDATPPIQKLRWHANGVAFELSTIIDGFSKKDLITIAESLVPPSAVPPDATKLLGPGSCGTVSGGAVGSGSFIWPSNNHSISGYDYSLETNHPGIDLAGASGDPVYASDNGVIVYAGWNDTGYGNVIVIDHGNGWQTLYAHLSALNVACGQSVGQGDVIGQIGSSGNIDGTHLHFEIFNANGKVNPHDYLPAP
jgi:hypothetical protein